jgi:hypothetical protein
MPLQDYLPFIFGQIDAFDVEVFVSSGKIKEFIA